jgi:hypothetical protein
VNFGAEVSGYTRCDSGVGGVVMLNVYYSNIVICSDNVTVLQSAELHIVCVLFRNVAIASETSVM